MSTFETKIKNIVKIIPNRFEQWFKKETWLEEQVLFYTTWTGNARALNMPESIKIYPNVGKYSSISVTMNVTCEYAWICVKY